MQVWGESHGTGVGVIVDGAPAGIRVDTKAIQTALDLRRPGTSGLVSPRRENDTLRVMSGVLNGKTTGAPVHLCILNEDVDSSAYEGRMAIPRPGHADLAALLKYGGHHDPRGGGLFSGRLTAAYVMAGALVQPILERHGVAVGSHLVQVGTVTSDASATMDEIIGCNRAGMLPCVDEGARALMEEEIRRVAEARDSVGAVIECVATGMPAGIGEPLFRKVDAVLSHAIMSVPGTKGISFGAGFDAAAMRGSVSNDPIILSGGNASMETNNAGGVLGGITTGMPIVFRVAMKPTPSIGREQRTVNLATGRETTIRMEGRHDPCIGVRAVPVVTHLAAFALADLITGASHGTD